MKRLFHILLLCCISAAMLTACESWESLEEHPKKVDASTFLSNAEEVQSVINSMYSQLRRDPGFGRYLSVLPEALADYCYGRGNYGTSFTTGLTSGAITFTQDAWAVLYRTIRFGNEILSQIDKAELTSLQYDHLTGEVRYLRALSYAFLVKYFGGVPLSDETNWTEFNKPRTPEPEIWQFVAREARAASELLPESVVMAGRPSRYAALMLLTEASLYLEAWDDAVAASSEIVNSGRYGLVQIASADDFEDVYGIRANATKEEIFYFKFNRDEGAVFPWMYLCSPNPIFPTGALGVYTDYEKNNFIREWDNADLRYQFSLYKQTENGTLNGLTRTGMICLKYRDRETDGSHFAVDFPLYRYADALLYYAEAVCRRDGRPDATAMEAVNQVRRRAYGLSPTSPQSLDYKLADYATADAFLELVLRERGYETIFEGKRYCDLKRCGKLAEYAVRAGRISAESEVGDAAYWWPIPTSEFNYNPLLDPTKDQNPGY